VGSGCATFTVIGILSRLPADLPAFIGVVIHRGADSMATWAVARFAREVR